MSDSLLKDVAIVIGDVRRDKDRIHDLSFIVECLGRSLMVHHLDDVHPNRAELCVTLSAIGDLMLSLTTDLHFDVDALDRSVKRAKEGT